MEKLKLTNLFRITVTANSKKIKLSYLTSLLHLCHVLYLKTKCMTILANLYFSGRIL